MSDATPRIRRRRWTANEDDTIRQRYGSLPAAEIARLLDRTEDAVWLRAKGLGLGKREERHDPWTAAELDEVRHRYSVERPAVIAKRLGRSVAAVSWQAQRMGVPSEKALIAAATVHGYFTAMDTAEKAYILGLIAADGNIADTHPRLIFGLKAEDAHLVEWVRDRLNPRLRPYRTRDGFTKIQITSRQMVTDLERHGIVVRKSRVLAWPGHLGPLLRPFLTGYFDGDGWVHIIKGKYPGWGACSGSCQFLADMKDYIRASTGVELQKIQHRPGADLWQVATTGRGAYVVDEWLHRDGLGLARKRFPEAILSRYR